MTEPLDRLKAALADRYAIERELGAGGMATVYLAKDLRHDRPVALKVLKPELARAIGPERFLREIRTTANLSHPHILPLFDSGEADGFLYYVMPYVKGESLRDRLKREKQLPVDDALQISREVADALTHAHSQGVIHRDIKPENILLEAGHAVAADFGISRAVDQAGGAEGLTGTGVTLGTPAYMSPEQAAGSRELDGRSDLYSLGCVLYEMLAGQAPFTGPTAESVVYQHLTAEPPRITGIRPAVPAQVAATLERALAKTPADRFRTSGEMAAALAQPVGGTKVRKPLGRAKALIYSGTILLGLATVAVIASQRGQGGPEFSEDVVVVLPFSNETGDPANDQVGRMVAHRIVEYLDRSGVARPAPAGAAIFSWGAHLERRAKDPRYDPVAALAAEYGAGTVVQGTIFAQGEQIRFVAELSAPVRGKRLPAIDPVVAPSDDHGVSGGMEAVAQRVAAAVAIHLDPTWGETSHAFAPMPSLAAYRDYVASFEAFFRDLEESRRLTERALQIDPTFHSAKVQLAVVHLNLGSLAMADSILKETEGLLDRLGVWERTQWIWARATLDGNREGAYRSVKDPSARTRSSIRPWGLGFEALRMNYPREALEVLSEIDPDTPVMGRVADYWVHLTQALHVLGEHDRELAEARRGRERHPDHPRVLQAELRAHAAVGRLQEVHDLVEEAIVKDAQPSDALHVAARELRAHGHLEASRAIGERALTYLQGRPAETTATRAHRFAVLQALYVVERWEEARPLAEALVQEDPTNPSYLGYLGVLAARRGDGTEAARISRELADLDRPYLRGNNTWWRAGIAALLGEGEEAVALLRQAHREGRWLDVFPHTDMDLEPLRGFPPFEEFMRPKG